MSEPTETEEQEPVTEPTTAQEHEHDDQEQDETEEEPSPGSEAARYRRRLREVEGEREALAWKLEAVQRQLVERLAGEVTGHRLGDVTDLWRDGVTLDELVDEHGQVDPGRVSSAVAAVVEAHPSWRRPHPDLAQGRRKLTQEPTGPSWSDLLSDRT